MCFWACGEDNFVVHAGGTWGTASGAARSTFTVRQGSFAGDGNGGSILACWHKAFTLKAMSLWRTNPVSLEQEREILESLGEDCELCPVLGVEDIQAPKKTGACRATAASTWHLALSSRQFYRSNPQQTLPSPPYPGNLGGTLCFLPEHIFQIYFYILPVPQELLFLSACIVPTN